MRTNKGHDDHKRDAQTTGGTLESGVTFKQTMPGLPDAAAIFKPSQKPPHEKDRKAPRGHKLRTNTQGY